MIIDLLFLSLIAATTKLLMANQVLSYYSLQLTACLIILYFAKPLIFKNLSYPLNWRVNRMINAGILTASVLLIVFSSGGPGSFFFFSTYFLLFGLAFLFEPILTISYSFILIAFLSPQVKSPQDLLNLISLVFIAPLAKIFGEQYLKNLTDQRKIKIVNEKLFKSEKSLASQEKNSMVWLSINFRNAVSEIIEITALLLSNLSRVSPTQKTLIKKIRRKSRKLLKEGALLKKIIDRETDEKKVKSQK